jgi:hypothetical protein
MRGGALYLESDILDGEEAERYPGDEHLARSPALEWKSPGESAEGPFLRVQVGEADSNHGVNLSLSTAAVSMRLRRKSYGRHRIRTCDFHRVRMAL